MSSSLLTARKDWYAQELADEQYTRETFATFDFTEASLDRMSFSECTFHGVQFNCSQQRGNAFVNCTFNNCSFFETTFTECKLLGSRFDRCTFDLMRVTDGNWDHVVLARADLRKVTFETVRFREVDLAGARLQGAVIRDCDLTNATLNGAVLKGCDLRGSALGGLEPASVDLRGAIVTVDQAIVIAAAYGLDVRDE
ncbi:MAG: pentapeptide repeat-containing protein [Gemmatimonadaceae bacterium]|nr:pentapeptide repeat-containing protein [Gemmatimonadaceae bacterium]